jgi:hypothetical protein
MTAAGEWYVSGVGTAFLQQLQVMVGLALAMLSSLLLIADGARALRSFFTDMLSQIARKAMILDWYHLRQKCLELSSRIWGNKAAKAQLLQRLYRRLWRGDVVAAITGLEGQRRAVRNEAKLDDLIAYLQARAPWIPNYRQRRSESGQNLISSPTAPPNRFEMLGGWGVPGPLYTTYADAVASTIPLSATSSRPMCSP